MPEPPTAAGNINHKPNVAVIKPISNMPMILAKAGSGDLRLGET